MNRTFSNIVSNVSNNIQDTSSAMQTIIKGYVNDGYFDFLRRANINQISEDYSFSTSDGVQDYVLPDNFDKELYVYDSTNRNEITRADLQKLLQSEIDVIGNSGVPSKYVILNKPVQKQPTSSSQLTIVSSSSSDTSQVIFVKGISGGVEVSESVSLNGTTNALTTNSYTEIISLSKSASTVGKVTVTSNSGAVTVGVIPPSALVYRIKAMRLHYIPNGTITIKAPYYKKPSTLVNDNDILDVDADDIVEKYATACAWRYKRQYAKAQEWQRMYEKSIIDYLWFTANQPNAVYMVNPEPYSRETV